MDSRLTTVEEALAHQQLVIDELNAVVTDQAARIALLERRMRLLMEAAAASEADGQGPAPLADQRPPHY